MCEVKPMPMYEYECATHGVFEALQSVKHAREPGSCPRCKRAAPRILSAPALAQVSGSERVARDRNERSRHEPRVAQKRAGVARELRSGRPKLQASPSPRPWVLEHH